MAYEPTLTGFTQFVRGVMGITTEECPDNSPALASSFAIAMEIVNESIALVTPLLYQQAVYNLAGDNLINFAPDQENSNFFSELRKKWSIGNFAAGVVQSVTDEGTSTELLVQEAAKNFTLANLQNLKTPYGRQYLYIAQAYGPSVGISV